MTSLKKLVARFLSRPPEVDVRDVVRLLQGLGFSHRPAKGSHLFFRRGGLRVSIPTVHGRKVKGPYVVRLIRLLELEDWADDTKENPAEDAQEEGS